MISQCILFGVARRNFLRVSIISPFNNGINTLTHAYQFIDSALRLDVNEVIMLYHSDVLIVDSALGLDVNEVIMLYDYHVLFNLKPSLV